MTTLQFRVRPFDEKLDKRRQINVPITDGIVQYFYDAGGNRLITDQTLTDTLDKVLKGRSLDELAEGYHTTMATVVQMILLKLPQYAHMRKDWPVRKWSEAQLSRARNNKNRKPKLNAIGVLE